MLGKKGTSYAARREKDRGVEARVRTRARGFSFVAFALVLSLSCGVRLNYSFVAARTAIRETARAGLCVPRCARETRVSRPTRLSLAFNVPSEAHQPACFAFVTQRRFNEARDADVRDRRDVPIARTVILLNRYFPRRSGKKNESEAE